MKFLSLTLMLAGQLAFAQAPRVVPIRGSSPLVRLRQELRTTYLIGAGTKPLHVPLTRAWPYGEGLNSPFRADRLGGVPGHFIVFTATFDSNPGNPQGHCGACGEGQCPVEVFLHIVSLSETPHETFAVQVKSCLLYGQVQEAQWNQKDQTLRAYIPGHPLITFHVSPEGELTPPPPKPVYSK